MVLGLVISAARYRVLRQLSQWWHFLRVCGLLEVFELEEGAAAERLEALDGVLEEGGRESA